MSYVEGNLLTASEEMDELFTMSLVTVPVLSIIRCPGMLISLQGEMEED